MIKAESTRCVDPGCSGRAEPEQDGDHTYLECVECGYAFGFTRSKNTANPAEVCAVGVSEDVRRAASQPMTNALAASQPLPLLSIGRRPNAPVPTEGRHQHS